MLAKHAHTDLIRLPALLIGLASLLLATVGSAQERSSIQDPSVLVHYSYATLMGTGFYRLDDRSVAILRVPMNFTLLEQTPDRMGIRLVVPTAVGLHNFDLDDVADVSFDDLATISIVPGVELDFSPGERWAVTPGFYLGYGHDLTNSESSIIYGARVTGVYDFKRENPGLTFGSEALVSGYTPENGPSNFLTRFSVGLDIRYPMGWTINGKNTFFAAHVIDYVYLNELEFRTIGDDSITLRNELEIGLALGRDPAFKVLGIEFDRIGLAYKFGPHIDAIVLVAGFPF